MTLGRFHKMHGLGNDFVIVDTRDAPLDVTPARAAAIADRRAGIGCDQLILIGPSDSADISMRIYNADGGKADACGNASRCVVALLGRDVSIETPGGTIEGRKSSGGFAIDMGAPRFEWGDIPLAYAMDSAAMPVGWEALESPMAVNVGNPHVVFFVEDAHGVPLERLGPQIENDPLFPERINVNVASVAEDGSIDLRVWERGAGLTRACGTGACATAVAAIRKGLAASPVIVRLPGGELEIAWQEGGSVGMTGPATHVFTGEADWDDFG